jgi:hypothetical protein
MNRAGLVLLLALVVPATALADAFRCPNGALVNPGQSLSEVALHCDAPTSKTTRTESVAGPNGVVVYATVEEWTYNEGPRRLVHVLVFRDGVLVEVQTLGYGT